ncbi:MAG: DUF4838 domain-containing protein [Candidatus Omnitrophica bacterium]|nr:DUF4838 domain-containing protein [Candidatus Omnitrophota bacterium]
MKCILMTLLFFLMCHSGFSEEFVVIQKDKPCSIVVMQSSKEKLSKYSQELADWLKRITTAEFKINSVDDIKGVTDAIILGTSEDFPEMIDASLGPEGFIIKSEKERLWIAGNSELGLQHGIYSFLEKIGCRWYFQDPVWHVIPQKKDIRISIDAKEKPSFAWRNIWYEFGPRTPKLKTDYENWIKYNRQQGWFNVSAGHSYARYIPPKEFEKSPELFSLVGGERKPTQICISNPEVQKRVIEGVLDVFKKYPDRVMVSVEPNDGGGFCECDNCKKLGSVSDQVFYLANLVAREVQKQFPGKYVGLLAYHLHSNPPSFKLEPNVHVEVTTGFRAGTKLTIQQQAEQFKKLGASVGVYDYFSVYLWDWDVPGAAKAGRFYALGEFIKEMNKIALTSYTAQSCCNWGPNGLGYWLAAKLMWDSSSDINALVEDFFENCFRKAKLPVRQIYERWARAERHTPRTLKLALQDLQQTYKVERDPEVQARLDRLAMYLHWLVLKMEYERTVRENRGKEKIIEAAKDWIIFSRRIMDTGLIHVYPMLFTKKTFGERIFDALMKIEDLDKNEVENWKKERQDIPEAEEIRRLFTEDIKRFSDLQAVEITGKQFSTNLVALSEKKPEIKSKFSEVSASPLYLESGVYYFSGKKGEQLKLTYRPFQNHTIDCHWKLMSVDEKLISEGDVKAEKGQEATIEINIPDNGIYIFDPGTTYWKSALITFDHRPLSVWAQRASIPGKPNRQPFKQWFPKGEPVYFYVPKGTKHFVIGFPTCKTNSKLVIKDENGKIIYSSDRVSAGDEISIIVPEGSDNQIWSMAITSLRNTVELYDIPPFLARHPDELIVPEDAIK